MHCPLGPAGIIGQLMAACSLKPIADTTAVLFKGSTHFTHHKDVRDEVDRKDDKPTKNNSQAMVSIADYGVRKAPDYGNGHEGENLPIQYFFFVHGKPPFVLNIG